MFFSSVHDWQGDKNVQQVLVFSNEKAKNDFDEKFAQVLAKEGIEHASENNLGAIFKVRAVRGSEGWFGVVRCGTNGYLLSEDSHPFITPGHAMLHVWCKFADQLGKTAFKPE